VGWRNWRVLMLPGLALGAVAGGQLPVRAQGAAPAEMGRAIDFDIPAQPLSAALVVFSRTSGMQVLYDTQAAAGKASTAVAGRMASGLALRRLLQDAGLSIRYAGPRSVTLVPSEVVGVDPTMRLDTLKVEASPARIGGQRFAAYANIILADLLQALQRADDKASPRHAVTIRLWLDAMGRVTRSDVAGSSGDTQFDAALRDRLLTVTASEPPPQDLPQPLAFELWTRGRP